MDNVSANYYTKEVMLILIREFQSPDEEMKKIVLKVSSSILWINCFLTVIFFSKVVKQCCATDGVEADYIRQEILPDYFRHFWNHRMALDRRNYKQVATHYVFQGCNHNCS